MKRLAIVIALLTGLALPAGAQPLSKAECRELATAVQEATDGLYAMQQATGGMAELWDPLRGRASDDLQRGLTEAQAATGELQRALNNIVPIYDDVAAGFRACSR